MQNKQDPHRRDSVFDGFYVGTSVGSQNIFGGALINDLDLLTQKSGLVLEITPGYRRQLLNNRFLVGFELQLGFTDGDLVGFDSRFQFDVFYKNNIQRGFGLIAGVMVGPNRRFLIYSYGHVTNRDFDIEFTESNGTVHNQEDGQRFLRYGVGVEAPILKKTAVRAWVGGVDVDFGDLVTSQDVEDKLDVNVGLIYAF